MKSYNFCHNRAALQGHEVKIRSKAHPGCFREKAKYQVNVYLTVFLFRVSKLTRKREFQGIFKSIRSIDTSLQMRGFTSKI